MKIMFVCTGNTCRSAMAEGFAKKLIKEQKLNIDVYSAGISAITGEHASYNSIAVMKDYDVDLLLHTSTNIQDSQIQSMDLILCMTEEHKKTLIHYYPKLNDKIYTLKEYADPSNYSINPDINDPWGGNINSYRICASEISFYIDKIVKKFNERSNT